MLQFTKFFVSLDMLPKFNNSEASCAKNTG